MNARWPGLFALLVLAALPSACGKSESVRPATSGGTSGNETAGGSGGAGASGSAGQAGSTATGGAAGSIIVVGGASGEGDGGASAGSAGSSGSGGAALAACDELDTRFTLNGDLPEGFGDSVTLTTGCTKAVVGDQPWPYSYSYRPFEGAGIYHDVLACNADETLKVELTLHFQPSGMTTRATFDVNQVRVFTAENATFSAFETTEQPFASWPYPEAEADGLGQLLSGNFEAVGASGGAERITGSFAVCHVANVPLN